MVGTDKEMLDICEALFKWRAVEAIAKKEPVVKTLVDLINSNWEEVKGKLANEK